MRPWSSTRALAAALTAVALPTLAAPAVASADGFTPVERIAATGPTSPRVASDAEGRSVLAWREGTTLKVATRAPGSTLSAPSTLGTSSVAPQVAVADDGTAFVASMDAGNVMLAVRPPGGSWSTSTVASGASGFSLAVTADGTANVLWFDAAALHLVTRDPAGNVTGPGASAVALPPGGALSGALLAAGADGELVAAWAWSQFDPMTTMTTYHLDAARRTGGFWSVTQPLESLSVMMVQMGSLTPLAIAMSPDKAAAVAWSTSQGMIATSTTTALKLAWASGGGAFESPSAVLDSGSSMMGMSSVSIDGLSLAFDGERAVAAWRTATTLMTPTSSTTTVVRTRSRAAGPGGAFSDPTDALTSTTDAIGAPALAARPGSGPFLAVPRPDGIAVASAPAGDGLGTAASVLSELAGTPEVSAAGAGGDDDIVGVTMPAGSAPFAGFTVFDTQSPVLSDVRVPANAITGAPAAMSATAADRWQTPTQTWDFGDGVTATGAAVAHPYAAPGAYTVKVGAHDGTSNSAPVQERAILVAEPPVDGGGPPAGGTGDGTPTPGGGTPGGGTPAGDGLTSTTFATVAFQHLRARPARRGAFGTARLACATKAGCRATISVTAAKGKAFKLGSATVSVPGAGRRSVTLALSKAGLQRLRKAHRLTVRITVKLHDANGRARTVTKTLRLTAPTR